MQDILTAGALGRAVHTSQSPAGTPDISGRLRSAGPLTAMEIAHCRAARIPLAFDPVQIGWVTADCIDDIDLNTMSARSESQPTAPSFRPRSLAPTYRFRPWHEDDLPVFQALLDDPAVWNWMYESYPNPVTEDLALQLIALSASDHHEVQAVLRDGEIVGQVRMKFEGAARETAEFSYWFGRAHWGKGLGSAIVAIHSGRTFLRHPGLQSIFAVVHPQNPASSRALLKAGYVGEGPDRSRPGWISYRLTRAGAEAFNSGNGPT